VYLGNGDAVTRNYYHESLIDKIIDPGLILVPGTSDIYELDLALGESMSLPREEIVHRGAMFWKVDGKETNHYRICSVSPLQVDPRSTMRRKTFFLQNLFKTGYATHGLFPYRGKFHPQLIKAVMNIIKIPNGGLVLDGMTGSGTVNVEASIMGINSVGIDSSPFCVLMSRVKTFLLSVDPDKLEIYIQDIPALFRKYSKEESRRTLFDFERARGSDGKLTIEDQLNDVFLLAYLDAMGYARRRVNQTAEKLFPVVLDRYIQAIRNFADARDKIGLELGKAQISVGDARDLKLKDNSVDGIVVSPPYSFAIDYVDNDSPQLEYLGIDTEKLKKDMIGLVGKTKQEKVKKYFEDMKKVIEEFSRVLKPGKCLVVVVGSNEIQTGGVRHEIEFEKCASDSGLTLFKKMVRPITGIGNSMRDEYVLFWTKD
jgi:hypothetical protein